MGSVRCRFCHTISSTTASPNDIDGVFVTDKVLESFSAGIDGINNMVDLSRELYKRGRQGFLCPHCQKVNFLQQPKLLGYCARCHSAITDNDEWFESADRTVCLCSKCAENETGARIPGSIDAEEISYEEEPCVKCGKPADCQYANPSHPEKRPFCLDCVVEEHEAELKEHKKLLKAKSCKRCLGTGEAR